MYIIYLHDKFGRGKMRVDATMTKAKAEVSKRNILRSQPFSIVTVEYIDQVKEYTNE